MSAAKKSFKDNPALQFISAPETEESAEPVMQPSKESPSVQKPEAPPAGYKIDHRYVETKSRRLQLVLQPSLYERVKKAASEQHISVNEYVHQILDRETPKNND